MENNTTTISLDGIDLNIDRTKKELISIIEDLSSQEAIIRKEAREDMINMGVNILPYVHKLIQSKDKQLRWEAAKIAQKIAHPSSIPVLIELLEIKETDIRWIASEGLINIGRESIVPLLKAIIEKEEVHFLRTSSKYVFKSLLTAEEINRYKEFMNTLDNENQLGRVSSKEAKKILDHMRKERNY